MANHNQKGRSKNDSFVMLERYLVRSPAYRSLHPYARALLVEIKYRYNGTNNGYINLSFREAMAAIGVRKKATERAFAELQDRGFIRIAKKGHFTVKEATTWTLTDVPMGGKTATRDFMKWEEATSEKQNIVFLRNTYSVPEEHCSGAEKAKNTPYSVPQGHCNPDIAPPLSVPQEHISNIPLASPFSEPDNQLETMDGIFAQRGFEYLTWLKRETGQALIRDGVNARGRLADHVGITYQKLTRFLNGPRVEVPAAAEHTLLEYVWASRNGVSPIAAISA